MNHARRLRRLALATLISALLAASLAAPAAQAATASVDNENKRLAYTGSSEANNVTVSGSGSTYTITDSGASISAGYGCSAAGAGKVTCSSSKIDYVYVRTDAGNDTVTVSGGAHTALDGGSGDDRLVGGSSWDWLSGSAGDDSLDGGAGSDFLSGGDGVDTVDYSARMAPVTVTLSSSSYWTGDDGEAAEYDNVSISVETILGGSANDTITGSSAKNTFKGGAGDDKLYGVTGDDFLDGGPGRDVFDGGDGDDVMRARDTTADQVACGAGADAGESDAIDAIDADCEAVAAPSSAGPAGNPDTTLDLIPARVRLTYGGKLRLRITCPEEFGTCNGTVVITPLGKAQASFSRRKSKAIGRGRYKVQGGETKVINVKLSRNGRRRVLRNKRLKCKASSVTRSSTGRKVTVRKKITLEAPRKKRS
jgi:Ca2+-binding RTX toxin-like protein